MRRNNILVLLVPLLFVLAAAIGHAQPLDAPEQPSQLPPASAAPATGTGKRRPNFLVFLADDMGYGDIGTYGAPTTDTPNIDELARRGMTMRQYYSAASVCTPSRAGLLTGREPLRTGMYTEILDNKLRVFYPFSTGGLQESDITIPTMLRRVNYTSALIGKWHLGHTHSLPTQRGFDHFFGIPYSHDMTGEHVGVAQVPVANRAMPPLPLYRDTDVIEQPTNLEVLGERLADAAVDFLEKQAQSDQPFFLLLAFYQPHVPIVPSPKFRGTSLRGPYGDFVQELDAGVGKVMAALKKHGLVDNTLVHFTSDNGPWVIAGEAGGSAAGFAGGKGTTWEGGMRVPAIFSFPGVVEQGTTSFAISSSLDLFRTFAEFAGVNVLDAEAQDSKSMACVLRGNCHNPHRQVLYYYYDRYLMAVRHGAFKAHFYTCSGPSCAGVPLPQDPPLLFNVEHDPFESRPLNVTHFPKVVLELKTLAELQRVGLKPAPSQLDHYDLLAAPCCNPWPLDRPCYGGCGHESSDAVSTDLSCQERQLFSPAAWQKSLASHCQSNSSSASKYCDLMQRITGHLSPLAACPTETQ